MCSEILPLNQLWNVVHIFYLIFKYSVSFFLFSNKLKIKRVSFSLYFSILAITNYMVCFWCFQHQEKYFHHVLSFPPLGSQRILLKVSVSVHTGCLKKTHLKEMCDFLTLKMLPLTLALIKTKNRHLFDPLVRKCSFYMRI